MPLTDEQKANRERWIEALESGEYTQATGVLRNQVGYCCLGVACDVLGIASRPAEGAKYFLYGKEARGGSLPGEAIELLGFGNADPFTNETGSEGKPRTLATLNDNGYTFKQIAQILRGMPEDWTG